VHAAAAGSSLNRAAETTDLEAPEPAAVRAKGGKTAKKKTGKGGGGGGGGGEGAGGGGGGSGDNPFFGNRHLPDSDLST